MQVGWIHKNIVLMWTNFTPLLVSGHVAMACVAIIQNLG